MKSKRMGWALLVVGVLLFVGWDLRKDIWPPTCDPGTSVLVAHAYVLSIPLLGRQDELVPFMNSAPALFTEGGRAIACMQSVGTTLVKKGVLMSNQFSGHPAMAKFGGRMPPGLASLPGQVDSALNSYGADSVAMGQEFLWLSRVLPDAARGNPTMYNTTGTPARQMARQLWPYYERFDPGACQIIRATINEQAPVLETQIYNIVVASND